MNLTKSKEPFNQMIDHFFNSSISDFLGAEFTSQQPAANIIENETDFQIQVAAPGLSKKAFKLEIIKDKLHISFENNEDKKDEDKVFTRREFNFRSFKRTFHIPENVDRDSVSASYKEGILFITLEKKEKEIEVSKSIKVN